MLLLTLFLRPAIAFWVFIGIPISFLGAFILMSVFDISLNMMSAFGFIIVLDIFEYWVRVRFFVIQASLVTGKLSFVDDWFRFLRFRYFLDQLRDGLDQPGPAAPDTEHAVALAQGSHRDGTNRRIQPRNVAAAGEDGEGSLGF